MSGALPMTDDNYLAATGDAPFAVTLIQDRLYMLQ